MAQIQFEEEVAELPAIGSGHLNEKHQSMSKEKEVDNLELIQAKGHKLSAKRPKKATKTRVIEEKARFIGTS